MVQNNVLIRQQQKISTLAILAALGSFITGAMLPWNLRVSVERAESPPASDTVAPPSSSTPEPSLRQPPTQPDENSTSTIPSTKFQPTGATISAIEKVTPVAALNDTSFTVETAMNQRVEQMQTKLVKLEKKRFRYPIPQQFQGKKVEEVTLKNNERVIALTFDDGPWPETTEQILEILEEYNIKATFFWVGAALKQHPEIAGKVAQAGHEIANHTWTHSYDKMTPEAAAEEIDKTDELIEELTGIKTTLFRPPGGVQDNGLVDYIYDNNYVNVMWSSDSFDWYDSAQQIVDNVIDTATPGGIILMHDGGGQRYATVEALPEIIDQLTEDGYRFVTVNELLHLGGDEEDKQELEAQQSTDLQKASRSSE
ncbi:MAG: polysaccharide deacetylase family protein [Microcoleaceae cyanobacterium]